MDRLKLSQLGEKLKTSGAQMSRLVSGKVKEMLQSPTQESKMVDEATLETLEEPNWGMNLRICALINSEEFSGTEVVKIIKRKISCKNIVSQRLSLELLEICAMNCEKIFSEVASEKVLEEMVRLIENPQTDHDNRERAVQLIRAWGQSEDLAYLPVFRQTYLSLQTRNVPSQSEDVNSTHMPFSMESYDHLQPMSPPDSYPVPQRGLDGINGATYSYGSISVDEKKELLLVTRNSLELLSSILNSTSEPASIKEDLTMSLLEKCKDSQPVIQRIVETTTDDEAMLFEALNLHEELQQVMAKYEELEKGIITTSSAGNSNVADVGSLIDPLIQNETTSVESHEKVKAENSSGEGSSGPQVVSKPTGQVAHLPLLD